MKYGLFSYKTSNIGDEVQSIAARQFLPQARLTYFDRDNIDSTHIAEKTKIIMNGWFTHKPQNWPPKNTLIDPLLISFHMANEWGSSVEDLLTPEALDFYKKNGPVGCRDKNTEGLLKEKGIDAYFSGCLTLTLKNKFKQRNSSVYIVDIDDKIIKYIPKNITKNAKYRTHIVGLSRKNDSDYKFSLAQERLDEYAQAKLVITSRLHCALPCIAFGTPVIFIHKNLDDPRFSGLSEYFHHYAVGDILNGKTIIDWENIKQNPKDISIIRNTLTEKCIDFIGENYYDNERGTQEGISIINASKNRTENLKKSLKTWLTHKEVSEIILVDWGCDIPLEIALKDFLDDKRIVIVRANQHYWALSKAFNLAADFVTKNKILKLDADILLRDNFFQKHILKEKTFYRGNWRDAGDNNEKNLNGVGFFYTDDFLKIGGYNELLTTWGHDDTDLYTRLERNNINPLSIHTETVQHIPHSDMMRFKYQKSSQNKSIENEKNTLLSQKYVWSKKKRKKNSWQVKKIHENHYLAIEKLHFRMINPLKIAAIQNIILILHTPSIFIESPKKILKIVKILWKKFIS